MTRDAERRKTSCTFAGMTREMAENINYFLIINIMANILLKSSS